MKTEVQGHPSRSLLLKRFQRSYLRKCTTLIVNSSEHSVQYALFLSDIGPTTVWLQNTECLKSLSVKFTTIVRDINKSSADPAGVSQETWCFYAHFVVLSYMFLNFSNDTPIVGLYNAILSFLKGASPLRYTHN